MTEWFYHAKDLNASHLTDRVRFSIGRLTVEGDLGSVEHRLDYWPSQDEGESGDIPMTTRIALINDLAFSPFTMPSDTPVEILD